MLAGMGYTNAFLERLDDHSNAHSNITPVKIHLLTLEDIFCETESYEKARNDLPRLSQLQNLDLNPLILCTKHTTRCTTPKQSVKSPNPLY